MSDRPGTVVPLVLVCLLLVPSAVLAADQLLLGKKLLIKNPPSGTVNNKVVHLAKDVSVTIGAAGGTGDPRCTGAGGGGGSLRIAASGGAGDVTIPLPCTGWTTNGDANTLYKYRDTSGTTCTLVLVKNGVLVKAVCKGAQVGIDLNGSMSPTIVVTTLNTDRYCTEYGGELGKDGSDDKTFLRKNAAPPPTCPSTTSTTSSTTSTTLCGATTGGFCWFLGTGNQGCNVVCFEHAFIYDFATESYAGTGGNDANCQAVLNALLNPAPPFGGSNDTCGGGGNRLLGFQRLYWIPMHGCADQP